MGASLGPSHCGGNNADQAPPMPCKVRLSAFSGVSLIALSLLSGYSASAQTTHAPVADPDQITEIVVTTERRSERLQTVPISIQAFSAVDMEERGVVNLRNLANFSSDVVIGETSRTSGGASAYAAYIRGIGTGEFNLYTDPAVGLYIDGVYVARTVGGLMSMADVAQVEVAKGPQGTLFGRNTLSGAISVTTTQPILTGDPEGELEFRLGTDGRKDLQGNVNAPLIDGKLGLKLAFATLNSEGYAHDVITDTNVGDEQKLIGRGALRFDPTDALDLILGADWTESKDHGYPGHIVQAYSPAPANLAKYYQTAAAGIEQLYHLPSTTNLASFAGGDPYVEYNGVPPRDKYNSGGASFTAKYDISDDLSLKSITAYRRLQATYMGTNLTPFLLSSTLAETRDQQISEEVQLNGKAFDNVLDYVAGLFYFDELGHGESNSTTLVGLPAGPNATETYQSLHARSKAAYLDATVNLTSQLALKIGARENQDDKALGVSQLAVGPAYKTLVAPITQQGTWYSFSPRLGLDYKVDDDILLYIVDSQGFKSGSFSGGTVNAVPLIVAPKYQPEKLTNYEIGAKTEWFDHRLIFNFATYYDIYRNIQLSVVQYLPSGALLTLTTNAGKSDVKGFETDIVAKPFPGVTLNANLGYVYAHFQGVSPTAVAAAAVNGNVLVPGTLLPQVPDWTGALGAQYAYDMANIGSFTLRSDLTYVGREQLTLGDLKTFQSAYLLLGARVSFTPSQFPNAEIAVQGTNLTNNLHYDYEAYQPTIAALTAHPSQSREVWVSGTYHF